jgi:ribosomal protein S18 acetylase RimI-like enzyme
VSAATELAIAPLADADIESLMTLWERCGLTRPWNDPRADIAFARQGANAAILVGRRAGRIAAAVMVGHDGHRGWFYYLGVDPDAQGMGFGRAITAAAEQWLRERGILKAQLLVRAGNDEVRAFYRSLGYAEQQRIVFAKWLDGRPPTP